MRVETTKAFQHQLRNDSNAINTFCTDFRNWKLKGEYSSYLFGKDSAYIAPNVGEESYKLRHVHLVPILDVEKLARWDAAAKRGSRKTSDRVLVYVLDEPDKYLLIYILPEPDAHRIAQMKTTEDRETMLGFAAVAEAFIQTGAIIA